MFQNHMTIYGINVRGGLTAVYYMLQRREKFTLEVDEFHGLVKGLIRHLIQKSCTIKDREAMKVLVADVYSNLIALNDMLAAGFYTETENFELMNSVLDVNAIKIRDFGKEENGLLNSK